MENVVVGRIVHLYDVVGGADIKCRAFLITDVHSPTTVSGQVFLSSWDPHEEDSLVLWVSSIFEERPKGETGREDDHIVNHWHDPRLC